MTVNRMARRFAIALAFGLDVAASAFAGQDALAHAKDLYASAAYDEALAMLDRLQHNPSSTDEAEVGQYRAFCLLALGRSEEGRRAIEVIVESNPLFLPSEQQTPPRLLAVFRDVRRQVLPRVVRDSYTNAKSAFDQQDLEAAATGFDRVLLLLNDPDSPDSEGSGDIRMLATGFRELSKLGLEAVPSATTVSPSAPSVPSAVAAPKPEAPPEVPEPRRTYGPEDINVTAPVARKEGFSSGSRSSEWASSRTTWTATSRAGGTRSRASGSSWTPWPTSSSRRRPSCRWWRWASSRPGW